MAEERILNFGGRTPLPDDALKFQVIVLEHEADYIRSIIDARPGLSLTMAVNGELDFIRQWGLTATRLPRLLHAAKLKHIEPKDYVQMLVERFVASLPQATRPPESTESSTRVKIVTNITGPNHALMLAHGKRHNYEELTVVFRDLLKFARFYGLGPLPFAALRDHAQSKGASPRDVVVDLIRDAVGALPDVVEPPKKERRRARG